jgi:hypothetical protein
VFVHFAPILLLDDGGCKETADVSTMLFDAMLCVESKRCQRFATIQTIEAGRRRLSSARRRRRLLVDAAMHAFDVRFEIGTSTERLIALHTSIDAVVVDRRHVLLQIASIGKRLGAMLAAKAHHCVYRLHVSIQIGLRLVRFVAIRNSTRKAALIDVNRLNVQT